PHPPPPNLLVGHLRPLARPPPTLPVARPVPGRSAPCALPLPPDPRRRPLPRAAPLVAGSRAARARAVPGAAKPRPANPAESPGGTPVLGHFAPGATTYRRERARRPSWGGPGWLRRRVGRLSSQSK